MAKMKQTRAAKLVRKVQAVTYSHALNMGLQRHSGRAQDAYNKIKVDPTTPMRKRVSEEAQARNNTRRKSLAGAIKQARSSMKRGPLGHTKHARGSMSADLHFAYARR